MAEFTFWKLELDNRLFERQKNPGAFSPGIDRMYNYSQILA